MLDCSSNVYIFLCRLILFIENLNTYYFNLIIYHAIISSNLPTTYRAIQNDSSISNSYIMGSYKLYLIKLYTN